MIVICLENEYIFHFLCMPTNLDWILDVENIVDTLDSVTLLKKCRHFWFRRQVTWPDSNCRPYLLDCSSHVPLVFLCVLIHNWASFNPFCTCMVQRSARGWAVLHRIVLFHHTQVFPFQGFSSTFSDFAYFKFFFFWSQKSYIFLLAC